MKSPIHGLKALIVAPLVVIALTANTFLTPLMMPAGRVRQIPITTMTMTLTSSSMMSTTEMVSSTQIMTTSTAVVPLPIPGFQIESIFLGLLLGIGVLIVIHTRRRLG